MPHLRRRQANQLQVKSSQSGHWAAAWKEIAVAATPAAMMDFDMSSLDPLRRLSAAPTPHEVHGSRASVALQG